MFKKKLISITKIILLILLLAILIDYSCIRVKVETRDEKLTFKALDWSHSLKKVDPNFTKIAFNNEKRHSTIGCAFEARNFLLNSSNVIKCLIKNKNTSTIIIDDKKNLRIALFNPYRSKLVFDNTYALYMSFHDSTLRLEEKNKVLDRKEMTIPFLESLLLPYLIFIYIAYLISSPFIKNDKI